MADIIQTDCLGPSGLPSLEDDSVDLIVTSPPYDGLRTYDGFTLSLEEVGRECFRVLKDGGVMAMVIQDQTKDFAKSLTTFRTAVQFVDNLGFKIFESLIYARDGKPGAWWKTRFRVDHEYILVFFKGNRPAHFDKAPCMVPSKYAGKVWKGTQRHTDGSLRPIEENALPDLKCRGTIWHYNTSNTERNKTKMLHPATFPDAMARDLILSFSPQGALVVDPFVGSGTTCVVAESLGRRSIGFEVSERWCDVARERLRTEVQPLLFL